MATATTQAKKPTRSSAKGSHPEPAAIKSAPGKVAGKAGAKPKPASTAGSARTRKATAKSAAKGQLARTAQPGGSQSRDSSMTAKEHADHVERIWDLARRIGIAMFVTWDGKQQRARPLAATVEKDEGAIYFLTDISGEKDDQIAEYPHVSVSFADHKSSRYVALAGRATVSNDRNRIRELWNPFAKAWWDSPEDPAIRVIRVVPQDAELWDSPGRIVTTISMLAAAVTGRSPRIGENAKVVL